MVVSSCKLLSNLIFKSHPIVSRMEDTTFHAKVSIWDQTYDVGNVKLTKADLKEFITSTGSDKGEFITLMSQNTFFIGDTHAIRSQRRNTNGNGQLYGRTNTEV